MSAIFGVFNLDGKPIAGNVLVQMLKPMAYWGGDGNGIWKKGAIGLGHLMLHNTPESLYETLPIKSRSRNYVITANARIDNRKELLKLFNIPASEYSQTPDSILILEAYKKWGEKCSQHLLGDWAFAIWDDEQKKLVIARDHQGLTGLYYYHHQGFFAFSSCVKGLLAVPEISVDINELYLAQGLITWPPAGEDTIYKGIFRLPPAHQISISQNKINIQRYWYLEHTPKILLSSDKEYEEAFMEIYTEAVHCRLRSAKPIGISLSGGLDSGSVAALAAQKLKKTDQCLQAFCAASLDDASKLLAKNRFEDAPYAKLTADYIGNIDLSIVKSEQITPLQGIERGLELHDEPVHAVANQFWMQSIFKQCSNSGIGTILTGGEGNSTVSWHGSGYLAQLARQMRWITLQRELMTRKDINSTLLQTEIKTKVIWPLLPSSLKNSYRKFKGRQYSFAHTGININFANRLNLIKQMAQQGFDPGFGISADCKKMRYQLIKPGKSLLGCRMMQSVSGFGLNIRDPTMDKRLIEYCLSIPDDQYLREGQDRYLIRRTMQGYLPTEVLLNTKRGLQSTDIEMRMRNDVQQLKLVFSNIENNFLAKEYLDLKKLRLALNNVEKKTPLTMPATSFLRGIMTGLFLLRF